MNYTSSDVPFTRIIEHKHFEFGKQRQTWITREYPTTSSIEYEEMYPIRDPHNLRMFNRYRDLRRKPPDRKYFFGGRLADYQYYDMHQVIPSARARAKEIVEDLRERAPAKQECAECAY